MGKIILRKYGEATTIPFTLHEIDGIDFKVDASWVSGDVKLMKDEGAEATVTVGFVDRGQGYSQALTDANMQFARGKLYIVDQGTKVWLDTDVEIETYGHASAQHPNIGVAMRGTDIGDLNNFDPANDAVADVTTVANVTNDVGITQAGADKVWSSAARTLTSFGTLIADIWSYATRVLTAGTNIVLAKGVGITGLNDLSLANIEATTVLAKTGADGDTLETLSDQLDGLVPTGARQITVQVYETGGTTPIPDVTVSIMDNGETVTIGRKVTDSNGQVVVALDDATYKVRLSKAGVVFTVPETVVVTVDATEILYGDTVVIAAPADPGACRVYDYLFLPGSSDKPTTVVSKALIKKLPYDKDGKLHSGDEITGVYSAASGLIYWDIVRGATVLFEVDDFIKITKAVPDLDTARLIDI